MNLFVKGFPIGWSEKELKDLFSKYGEVQSVFIQREVSGLSKRNGAVLYKRKEDAKKA